jgi:ATP-binding cassette, subfamily B, bacterial
VSEKLEWIRKALSGHFTRGANEELDLASIVQISLGTLHFFKPLLRAVLMASPALLLLGAFGVYFGVTTGSVFANGLLNARPIEPNQAFVLFLDAQQFVRSEIEQARGLDRASLQRTARAAGYTESDLFVWGDDVQRRKDAFEAELKPHLAALPNALPAEISWELGVVRRWELSPALAPEARATLAWHWIAALILVTACGAAAYFGLYRRTGRAPSAVIVLLAVTPLAPFFIDATWNGVWHGRPIQPATATFLRVDLDETVRERLAARRGLEADVLAEAAGRIGLRDALAVYAWEPAGDERTPEARIRAGLEERRALADEIERAYPEALPVELRRRTDTAWRPRISAQLTADARRQLRDHLVIWVCGVALLLTPVAIGAIMVGLRLLQEVNQRLRVDLMTRIQTLSLRHHAESHVGDTIYRLFQDTTVVLSILRSVILVPLFHLSFVPVSLFFLSVFSPWLSVGVVLAALPMLWFTWRASPQLRQAFRTSREAGSALTSRIQETLAAIKVIKAYGAERIEQARFEQASEAAFAGSYVARTRLAGLGILLFLCSGAVLVLGDSWIALEAAAESPTAMGALIAFVGFGFWNLGAFTAARGRLRSGTRGVERLLTTWARAQDQAVGMDRVLELLTLTPEVQNSPDAVPLESVTREVGYRDVRFAYQADRPVLGSVSFGAAPGTVTAIVGPTGSGKSTLVSLLVRLYDPQAGSISIDGRDLRLYDLESLRDRIGIALQQNLLFGTTIRENIRYAVPHASDEQVRAAARVACADEFIEALPLGYDTPLGERGAKLSTGQRQRLSIARAVIKDPAILVLDEPTAALDAETELRVLERLGQWASGRVIFLITHRLSTIRRVDQIVYLKDGRVGELGSPEELVARPGGLYRRFVEIEGGPLEAPRVAVAANA